MNEDRIIREGKKMTLNGIDISSWQTGIDLNAVQADFVIIKATQGVGYVNPDCDRAYQQAKKAGKLLGVYHYAGGNDPLEEAKYFIKNIEGYIKEAVLCLDWESGQNSRYGVDDFTWCKMFLDYVASTTGVKPILYCSQSIMGKFMVSEIMACGLLSMRTWMQQDIRNIHGMRVLIHVLSDSILQAVD